MTRLLPQARSQARSIRRALPRVGISALVLGMVAACATNQTAEISAPQQAAQYAARARGNYVPPGPPGDPWGPYIREAAQRFDVPEDWVRAVMHVESGGQEYQDGHLVTSNAGAMGLMQVMPETYQDLREQYGLGDDPFDPHDNIIAGVAYMREMYDIYGSPGFLAAYNAGPARLDDYLSNQRTLPEETRNYVAMIAPAIAGIYPVRRSPAEAYAMNDLPTNIPAGYRYGHAVMVAATHRHGPDRREGRHSVLLARASHGEQSARLVEVAMALPPEPPRRAAAHGRHRHDFTLVASAQAAEAVPVAHGWGSGGWAIQVGAFSSASLAHQAAGSAKARTHLAPEHLHMAVATIHAGHSVLYRARLVGLSRSAAVEACHKLARAHDRCMVISPESQS